MLENIWGIFGLLWIFMLPKSMSAKTYKLEQLTILLNLVFL